MSHQRLIVIAALAAALMPGFASGYEILHPADVAKAVALAKVTLDRALTASQAVGTPISAKYELDDRSDLKLSVYTAKFDGAQPGEYREVFVDSMTGQIVDSKLLTDPNDLKHAAEQAAALGNPPLKLADFAARTMSEAEGYVLAGIFPLLKDGAPTIEVHLMKGSADKQLYLPAK